MFNLLGILDVSVELRVYVINRNVSDHKIRLDTHLVLSETEFKFRVIGNSNDRC